MMIEYGTQYMTITMYDYHYEWMCVIFHFDNILFSIVYFFIFYNSVYMLTHHLQEKYMFFFKKNCILLVQKFFLIFDIYLWIYYDQGTYK